MNTSAILQCFLDAAESMIGFRDELCRLDLILGDGDHGVTIARGYQAVVNQVSLAPGLSAEDFFFQISDCLMESMGGAIGPVYALLYESLALAHRERDEITVSSLGKGMMNAVREIGSACQVKQGEKTVYDALVPAALALSESQEASLAHALRAALVAAQTGRDATGAMPAQKGRARFSQDRSIGPLDPGACSFTLWLEALLNAVEKRMET